MIFFAADQHFGHANVIKLCGRPYTDVQEMDETLIENWNRRVTNGDTIYIIGDLFFRNTVPTEKYLMRLKGKKHLILGNHENTWIRKVDNAKYFLSIDTLTEIGDGQRKLILCHYPMMSWNALSRGSYMIHEHIHENTNAQYWPLLQNNPNILNAGVDINNFSWYCLKRCWKTMWSISVNITNKRFDRRWIRIVPLTQPSGCVHEITN